MEEGHREVKTYLECYPCFIRQALDAARSGCSSRSDMPEHWQTESDASDGGAIREGEIAPDRIEESGVGGEAVSFDAMRTLLLQMPRTPVLIGRVVVEIPAGVASPQLWLV